MSETSTSETARPRTAASPSAAEPSGTTTPGRPPHPATSTDRMRISRTVIHATRRIPRPRIGATLAIGVGTLVSLAPNLLPRTPGAQAILTGLSIAVALAVAGAVGFLVRRGGFDLDERFAAYRGRLLVCTVALIVGAAVRAGHWQNGLRAVMGAPAIGLEYWARCGLGAALIVGVLVGLARAIGWGLRGLGAARAAAVTVCAAVAGYQFMAPAVVDWRSGAYAAADALMDASVIQPVSYTRSGSADSAVSWPSLGAQGRRFVTGGPSGPVRVYVGLNSAPDLDSRVALAVRDLERAGGFLRSNVVVTVPTGSGWIDAEAATGFAERFGDDVALVGLQYSVAPSWATFVFGRDSAVRATRALFTAVEKHLAGLEHRPRLYVYGQSLGALGGSAIFADDADQDRRTCAALWAGPPSGAVHRGGATVLANSSDPVVQWSSALLWHAPDTDRLRIDAPRPRWLPVVSFLQTTADLLSALDAPRGHGHRYGTDQGTSLGSC